MLGQYEFFDAADWVADSVPYDFYDYGIIDYGLTWDTPDYSTLMPDIDIPDIDVSGYTETTLYGETNVTEYPSETRFISTYQAQQEAIQAKIDSGGGMLDVVKGILGLATPIAAAAMRADQRPATQTRPWTSYLPQTSPGVVPSVQNASIGRAISSLTSSPLLLLGLGVGGFMLLKKSKKRPQAQAIGG